jgi:hypothetical protein
MLAREGAADERWVIEPGAEAENAEKLGAAEVQRAQKLAKAKKYAEAAAVLEQVSRKWPAAIHDCNLALAYLRAGAYTRAQVVWELSALRNTTRPAWCTGEVSTQLSNALRAAGFVPTTIDVVPSDAVLEVGGVAVRGIRTVWLPTGTHPITATAPGRDAQTVSATVVAPSTRIAITLKEPAPIASDAGVIEPMAQSDAAVAPPADASTIAPLGRPTEQPLLTVNGAPVTRRYIALGVTVLGVVGTGVFAYLTKTAHGDANQLYPTDPEFSDAKSRHSTMRTLTIASAVVTAVGAGFYIYFTVDDNDGTTPTGVALGYRGTFGDSGGARK